MPSSFDYTRRRLTIVALGALVMIGAAHRTPVIGSISISLDDHLAPQVDADWSPPVALAIAGMARIATLIPASSRR